MIRKSTRIVLIIFMTILFYWLISEFNNWNKVNINDTNIIESEINTIKISHNKNSIYILKNKEGWTINDLPVKADKINIIIKTLKNLSNRSLISKNTHEKAIYGLDKKSRTQIECIKNGKTIFYKQ